MKTHTGTNGDSTRGKRPRQKGQVLLKVTIEKLYQQANLLSHAIQGILGMAEECDPDISWADELCPVADLAITVAFLARGAYLEVDQEAAKEAEERQWEHKVLSRALVEQEEGQARGPKAAA